MSSTVKPLDALTDVLKRTEHILAGTVRMEIEGHPIPTLNAGDPFLIPPRTPHNALDLGPDTGRMLSTYIVEPEEPLATFTQAQEGGNQP